MTAQLKGLDNIYAVQLSSIQVDVSRNVTYDIPMGFEKESNDPIKTTRKEGGVTGVINVCPRRLPRRAPGKLRRRIQQHHSSFYKKQQQSS